MEGAYPVEHTVCLARGTPTSRVAETFSAWLTSYSAVRSACSCSHPLSQGAVSIRRVYLSEILRSVLLQRLLAVCFLSSFQYVLIVFIVTHTWCKSHPGHGGVQKRCSILRLWGLVRRLCVGRWLML
jgi:hypothetical protein